MAFLEIDGVTKRFGGLVALNSISFSVAKGEIVGIIGPNGAGKTTLFGVISGFEPPNEGACGLRERVSLVSLQTDWCAAAWFAASRSSRPSPI
jgi:ABC-type branched-subunit amino acid transport system ATPase component